MKSIENAIRKSMGKAVRKSDSIRASQWESDKAEIEGNHLTCLLDWNGEIDGHSVFIRAKVFADIVEPEMLPLYYDFQWAEWDGESVSSSDVPEPTEAEASSLVGFSRAIERILREHMGGKSTKKSVRKADDESELNWTNSWKHWVASFADEMESESFFDTLRRYVDKIEPLRYLSPDIESWNPSWIDDFDMDDIKDGESFDEWYQFGVVFSKEDYERAFDREFDYADLETDCADGWKLFLTDVEDDWEGAEPPLYTAHAVIQREFLPEWVDYLND